MLPVEKKYSYFTFIGLGILIAKPCLYYLTIKMLLFFTCAVGTFCGYHFE